jgi:hypothetical protein
MTTVLDTSSISLNIRERRSAIRITVGHALSSSTINKAKHGHIAFNHTEAYIPEGISSVALCLTHSCCVLSYLSKDLAAKFAFVSRVICISTNRTVHRVHGAV